MHSLIWHGKTHQTITKYKNKPGSNNVLQPVEAPHPGTSYNPSFKDHQDLLKKIVDKECEIIKQQEHLTRVTSKMFKKTSPKENQVNS